MAARVSKRKRRRIARERIDRLLELAEEAALDDRIEDASRYAELAWRLAERHLVPIDERMKALICRGCKTYQLAGRTARVRITAGHLSRTCLACGRVRRVPLDRRSDQASEEGSDDPQA